MNIRQRFRQSLKCGTGEAYLIVKANPDIDFSNDIKKAALTNYAYDPQCEGDRAFYVAQLIELSDKKEQLVGDVLKALGRERKDCWNLDQLFELAGIFAQQGNVKAKRCIYKKYPKKVIKDADWLGEDVILKINGIEGLKFIAEVKGKVLNNDPDAWEDGFRVDCFQEDNPDIEVYAELTKAAKDNPFIKKYLDEIKKRKISTSKTTKRPKVDYQLVKNRIESPMRYPAPPAVAKKLTKTDLRKLADDFLQEKDIIKKEKYLSVFAERKYPYDYQIILQIAKGKNHRDHRFVERACSALSFFEAKDIRKFAIEKLSITSVPWDYLPLLVSNYKSGDHKLLSQIAERYKNEDLIHALIWGYVNIFKANKTKQCRNSLEIIYRKLTCGIHRYDILEILHENGVLPKRILKEMEFDSYDAVRELHQKICENS